VLVEEKAKKPQRSLREQKKESMDRASERDAATVSVAVTRGPPPSCATMYLGQGCVSSGLNVLLKDRKHALVSVPCSHPTLRRGRSAMHTTSRHPVKPSVRSCVLNESTSAPAGSSLISLRAPRQDMRNRTGSEQWVPGQAQHTRERE
jgi:hypothetical protein